MAADSDARFRLSLDSAALGLALAGGIAVALGSGLGASEIAGRSVVSAPIAAAAIVACGAQVLVPAAAILAVWRGRRAVGLGLLIGSGGVAVAQLVADGQLFAGPLDANRFELSRPLTAAEQVAGPGAYCVLIGHVALVIAAVAAIAALAVRDDDAEDVDGRPLASVVGTVRSLCVVFAAVTLAVAVFADPWRVDDPVIVSTPALDAPWFVLAGTVLFALVVLAGVAAALASADPSAAGAALAGIGVAAFGVVGSRWAAGVADAGLDPSPATVVASVAALLLVAAGVLVLAPLRLPAIGGGLRRPTWRPSPDVLAGVSGLTAAAAIGVGALTPLITVPEGATQPTIHAARTALLAAAVLGIVAVWLLLSEFAALVRPALGVLSVAVLMACASVLGAVVEAQRVGATGVGVGGILLGIGALACAVAGTAAAVGGAVERDTIDVSAGREPDRRLLLLGGGAAVTGVVALGLPLYRGTDGSATSFAIPWAWDAWGQIVFAVALAVVANVGPHSRPERAAAAYAGAALGLAVYLAGWPLTAARVADPAIGPGAPAAGLSIVSFVTASVVAARSEH